MKKKLPLVLVALLAVAGVAFKMTRPAPPAPKMKVHGTVYVMPKDFLINLKDGRFAKLSVGLIVEAAEGGGGGGHGAGAAAPEPPEGYGAEPQEAIVRSIVTDTLTAASSEELLKEKGRTKLKKELKHLIETRTDVHAKDVLFMDLTVS